MLKFSAKNILMNIEFLKEHGEYFYNIQEYFISTWNV